MRLQPASSLVFAWSQGRFSMACCVFIRVLHQMQTKVFRGYKGHSTHFADVTTTASSMLWIRSRMMSTNVFPQNNPLVESPGTNRASVRFFTRVNTLVFSKCSTISKSLPTEPAGIWSLSSMDTNVDLLAAAGSKCFTTVTALKQATSSISLAVYC